VIASFTDLRARGRRGWLACAAVRSPRLVTVTLAAWSLAAAAQPAAAHDAVTANASEAAREYWTAARMRDAIRNSSPPRVAAIAASRATPAPTQLPGLRAIGRVFSVLPDGSNYSCTGTLVDSVNRSLVWTAGHCLHRGRGSVFHTNVVFVPGYQPPATGNFAPYGIWPAAWIAATGSWIRRGFVGPDGTGSWDIPRFDAGVLVLSRDAAGRTLTDALGVSQHIAFRGRVRRSVRLIGYPTHAPYAGEQMMQCGPARARRRPWARKLRRIPCRLNHGMSGGPALMRMDATGIGVVVGPITAFDLRHGLYFSDNRGELRRLYETYTAHPN
jgi:V8-like Glu-specific endopeptidase